jgi:hypothetical protein
MVLWMKLNLALHYNKRRLANNDTGEPSNRIGNFLNSIKKGSVKFRKILTQKSIVQCDPAASQSVTTFCRNANSAIPEGLILRSTLGTWNMNFLTNELREFIYLGRNNFLRVGAIAAHIRENVDSRCTLCRIVNADTIHRETFTHLFYMCPVTKLLLRGLTRTVGLSFTPETPDFTDMYWFGKKNDKFNLSIFLTF